MSSLTSIHPWTTPEWQALQQHASSPQFPSLSDLLKDQQRNSSLIKTFTSPASNSKLSTTYLDLSRCKITSETIKLLINLAKASKLNEKIIAMKSGDHQCNPTENRAVLHCALRASKTSPIFDKTIVQEVHQVLDRIYDFSTRVRNGTWTGCTGKKLTNVVSIGIGGSYLGPEFVHEALRFDPQAHEASKGRKLRFLANVDPVDVARALEDFDAETTLIVVVSKTFTTAETMLNARSVRRWLLSSLQNKADAQKIVSCHMVAVSADVPKAKEFGIAENNVFGFWDWVGGRYSVCSAVGAVPLALQYGKEIFELFLTGAREMDEHFFNVTDWEQNLPVLMGLIGVWNHTFLGYTTRAILPYSQALLRFPAHIQQVSMESNGKRVSSDGTTLPFQAGEIIFGEPGTNGQHSFYQLIHQGRVIPCDFIGVCQSQYPLFSKGEEVVSNHDELMSNFFAQPDALALGKSPEELRANRIPEILIPHKTFTGNRPSLSLLLPVLDAIRIGQLLALYENQIAVQGFIWGINSFDQWGVELGKVLATNVRNAFISVKKNNRNKVDGNVDGQFLSSTKAMMDVYLGSSGL
jgi:glucose-6-phosphate isomerase